MEYNPSDRFPIDFEINRISFAQKCLDKNHIPFYFKGNENVFF